MGYTTEFIGKFVFDKEPSTELREYINCFSKTRHVKRDVEAVKSIFPDYEERSWKGVLGDSAEFFLQPCDEVIYKKDDRLDMAGFYKRNGIIDDNKPPLTQPGLWCHWIINSRGELVWNGAEKFYCYVEWLEYLIVNFFAPEGLMLSGRCFYSGEKMDDWGYIVVDNNHVEKIPNNISTFDQDDIICVRMPYVIKEELEKKVAYKYGISLEQTLQRFITWCAEEPESFTIWYRESRKKNVDYTRTGSTLHVLEGQELERAVGNENLTIENEKPAQKDEKLDYSIIAIRITAMNYNEPTPSNIQMIYRSVKANQVFGASDIKGMLGCSYTTAKALISKLYNGIEVIVPEKKHGKGKYRFKNYDEV